LSLDIYLWGSSYPPTIQTLIYIGAVIRGFIYGIIAYLIAKAVKRS